MSTKAKVAVIGGGPLGLMALKNFKEDGFEVTLFESRSWVGGLWKHSTDDSLSTAENTVFNSSKYRTAVSDFPVPEDMDDFPPAPQLHKYLESYCDHFDLWPHIKLNTRVDAVSRTDGRWTLETSSCDGTTTTDTYVFDKVAFSCGPFVEPRLPKVEGLDKFKGKNVHAIHYNNPSQFKDQNVVVMGVHASAQDVVSGLSKYASKVYLSHRSSIVLIPRYTKDGSVYDRQPPLGVFIIFLYLAAFLPALYTWILDTFLRKISREAYPNLPPEWGFDSPPSAAVASPLIATDLYPHLESGFCEPVADITRITGPRTLQLKSGRILTDIDTIVYCTGYHSLIPVRLEPPELNPYPYPGAPPTLYRNIFSLHPDPSIRNSIAFLGQVGVPLPGFVQHEMPAVAVSQIWLGRSSLPPLAEMQRWQREYISWRERTAKKYGAPSTFYTVFVPIADHVAWMDECAGLGLRKRFGLVGRWTSVKAWRLWWTDRELYNICLTGLTSPAIFRLFDEGKRKAWAGAREQIFIDNERVQRQQKTKLKSLEKESKLA